MAGFIAVCVIVFCLCVIRIKSQDKEISRLGEELRSNKVAFEIYKSVYQQMEHVVPDGTIEAVKYAMIKSHPDNGGEIEKFILYRECYEKLTGRNRSNKLGI